MVPAREVADLLAGAAPAAPSPAPQPASWKERLWVSDPRVRLGVAELSEAIGKARDTIYKLTSAKGNGARIPHRKLGGELVFVVGEVRRWLEEQEQVGITTARVLSAGPGRDHARARRKMREP